MWEAEVYFLAGLIAFFSGAWPYIKLVLMLVGWFAPVKLLSVERRESLLIILDALGKWSLVDFFVMVLFLCAFYIQLWIGNIMLVDVTVMPKWGFYSFLLATMISLGLGHVILACHRLIVEPKVLPIPDSLDPKESLSSIIYEFKISKDDLSSSSSSSSSSLSSGSISDSRDEADQHQLQQHEGNQNIKVHEDEIIPLSHSSFSDNHNSIHALQLKKPSFEEQQQLQLQQSENDKEREETEALLTKEDEKTLCVQFTLFGKIMVTVMILINTLFILAGTFLLTMGFEFRGLVGLMLKDDADIDYSYVSIGNALPEHSGIPNDFGVRWMQASYFLFGLAMPLGFMVTMLILWLIPMNIGWQRTCFVLSEVLNAWSALDVFCIAMAASLLEIQQFAEFVVGDSCDKLNVFLAKYMDDILEGDDTCFDVVAYLKTVRTNDFLSLFLFLLSHCSFSLSSCALWTVVCLGIMDHFLCCSINSDCWCSFLKNCK
jgi:hypothetical protein